MSLERRDIRAKLDPDMHEALAVLAGLDGIEQGEFVERLLVQEIERRIHDAIKTYGAVKDLRVSGTQRDLPGVAAQRGRK